jgi:hypothetical protein
MKDRSAPPRIQSAWDEYLTLIRAEQNENRFMVNRNRSKERMTNRILQRCRVVPFPHPNDQPFRARETSEEHHFSLLIPTTTAHIQHERNGGTRDGQGKNGTKEAHPILEYQTDCTILQGSFGTHKIDGRDFSLLSQKFARKVR